MKHDTPRNPGELRRQAEERLSEKQTSEVGRRDGTGAEETAQVLHELRVHQIELEMQNEELRKAQAEIEAVQARYLDLYDLAPVGYVTVSEKGLILEANLTAATLLGVNRDALVLQPLTRFILKEDQDLYYLLRKKLSETPSAGVGKAGVPQTYELRMVKPDGAVFWARLDATATEGPDGAPAYRVVLSDITTIKDAEETFHHSQERFRIAQEMSPDGFTILRPVRDARERAVDFTWVYENPAIARLNGTNPEKVVGQRLLELFPGHRGTPLLQVYQQVVESGEPQTIETGYSGETMVKPTWFRIVVVPMAGDIAILAQDITERKLAEKALRIKNLVFAASIAANSIADLSGNITEVNKAFLRVWGYPGRNEVVGKPISHFINDPNEAVAIVTALNSAGQWEGDYTAKRKDGSTFIAHGLATTVKDEKGTVIGYQSAVNDVTQQKRAEARELLVKDVLTVLNRPNNIKSIIRDILLLLKQQTGIEAVGIRLKEGEDFPYTQTSGFPDRFVELENQLCARDAAGRILRNDQGLPVLECMCGNVICGRTNPALPFFTAAGSFWSNCTTDLLASTTEADRQAHTRNRCNGVGYESVALIPLKAGDETIGLLQFNDHQRNQFTLDQIIFLEGLSTSIGIAITRTRADEKQRESAQLIEGIINAIPVRVFWKDAQLVFLGCNAAFARDAGFADPKDLVGKDDFQMGWREQAELYRADDRAVIESGRARLLIEEPQTTPTGKTITLLTSKLPLLNPQGKISGVIGTYMDITERKQAEGEQIKLQSQLVQAQKMESVGRLAGGVAHDFNNMLGVILGLTEMALEQMDPAQPLFADLQEVHKAAERSAVLTRQLLTFARKQTIVPRVIELNETVEGMLKMLRRLIGEGIDLLWKPGRNLGPVKVDPSQIDQLLANLCVNARDAIEDLGKITIETDVAAFDEAYCADHAGFVPGEYVLMAVSDNGCGMDKETMGHLFEPFFTTKEVGKGTGLGLASVYGMVKQNNGFINVYSEPGQGTTFKVYLPRHKAKSASLPEKAPSRPAERGHETILLVEDEPAILKMTTMMLERLGYAVLAAATPGEAIRLAHEHAGEIHMLMTDVVMPEMNGRNLAGNLLSIYPDLKRLFMSGYTADVIAHHGVLDEGVYFIQKPFSMKDLAAQVRKALCSV